MSRIYKVEKSVGNPIIQEEWNKLFGSVFSTKHAGRPVRRIKDLIEMHGENGRMNPNKKPGDVYIELVGIDMKKIEEMVEKGDDFDIDVAIKMYKKKWTAGANWGNQLYDSEKESFVEKIYFY